MPPKGKKGAKKGTKGKQDEEEFVEPEAENKQEQQTEQQVTAPVVSAQANPKSPSPQKQEVEQPAAQVQPIRPLVAQPVENENHSNEVQNQPNQSGEAKKEVNIDAIKNLSFAEKKELRKFRFQNPTSGDINTVDAIQKANEEKEKKLERAKKFGLITEETEELKRQQRAQKFGLESTVKNNQNRMSRDEIEQKRRERAERFGVAAGGNQGDDLEKKKQRAERFGLGNENANGDDKALLQKRMERFGKVEDNNQEKFGFGKKRRRF